MISLVTTETVVRTDKFDHWAHEVGKVFAGIDSQPVAKKPFHGKATSDVLGSLRLASIDAGPLAVRRTKRLTAGNEGDHYKVAVQISGSCQIEQDDAQESLGPGDIAICDTTRPYSFTYTSDFRTVLLLLPRPLLSVRPETMRTITARRLASSDGVGAVVGPFVRSLGEQSRLCSDAAVRNLTDGAVSLVTALVWEKLAASAPSMPQQAMMLRIRSFIEDRLANPELNPDLIADAHGISRRYLFKLFAAEDQTVAGWIRTRRLERCSQDLSNPAFSEQSISMVAARWGLLDCRHFSRVFKSVYGETPRDYRRRALA